MLPRDGAPKLWCGRAAHLGLHSNKLLVLRGHNKLCTRVRLTRLKLLVEPKPRLDNVVAKYWEECGVNCSGLGEKGLTDDVNLSTCSRMKRDGKKPTQTVRRA